MMYEEKMSYVELAALIKEKNVELKDLKQLRLAKETHVAHILGDYIVSNKNKTFTPLDLEAIVLNEAFETMSSKTIFRILEKYNPFPEGMYFVCAGKEVKEKDFTVKDNSTGVEQTIIKKTKTKVYKLLCDIQEIKKEEVKKDILPEEGKKSDDFYRVGTIADVAQRMIDKLNETTE